MVIGLNAVALKMSRKKEAHLSKPQLNLYFMGIYYLKYRA
jgi:hypothetical protein